MAAAKRKFEGDYLEQFVSSSNDVIHFKFVMQTTDVEDGKDTFPPEYTHQFFGESENIFGYVGLKVDIYYSACWLNPFFQLSYRQKVKPQKTGGIEADNVYNIIKEKQELDLETDKDKFKASLEKESSFRPYGTLLGSFEINQRKYKVYKADCSTEGFLEYHAKMRTLILWFIDAASYFDEEDEKWDYFILHEEVEIDGKTYYPFIGYTTAYRYYSYPQKIRPRISQMLILPLYQKKGLGTLMLENISKHYVADPEVTDITVEDPSSEFTRIRDFIDCRSCASLSSFKAKQLVLGFSQAMIDEAEEKFKLNKKQARRVYEILRLKVTDLNNLEDYKAYRLDVKNRLNIPFQREKLDLEKLQKTLSQEELKAAANTIPRDQRMEQLDQMYQELEARYQHTIDRLMLECPELTNGTSK